MTISAAGGVRIPDATTASKGILLRKSGERDVGDAGRGLSAGVIGLLAAGGVGIAGGLVLRGMGHGRIGTAVAAIGGAVLGASLLAGCATTPNRPQAPARTRTVVPGDEGAPGGGVDIDGSWTDLPPTGSDSTNPAPANWLPQSGTLDAREGVVQISHSRGLGSGWVVEPGKIITNYHVAQGYEVVDVIDHEGATHRGTVQFLDRDHDLALVSAPTIDDAPLEMDDVVEDIEGAEITGYPDGAFRNDAANAAGIVGIVDDGRAREALMLLGESREGVSGGAVINGAGEVIGTSFAVGELEGDGDPLDFVLAIPNDQVRTFLDASR